MNGVSAAVMPSEADSRHRPRCIAGHLGTQVRPHSSTKMDQNCSRSVWLVSPALRDHHEASSPIGGDGRYELRRR